MDDDEHEKITSMHYYDSIILAKFFHTFKMLRVDSGLSVVWVQSNCTILLLENTLVFARDLVNFVAPNFILILASFFHGIPTETINTELFLEAS